MFRSELMCVDDEIWTPVNIRLDLEGFSLRKSQRKVLNRCHSVFRTTIGPLQITEEKEALYRGFKNRFKGFVHDSLGLFLNEGTPTIDVEAWEFCVWDKDRLIAFSLLDRTANAAASLLCVYHPDYKRWSLGYCTMLLEALWARDMGLRWFYPGYVFDRPSLFDYKLRLGPMRYRTPRGRWAAWSHYNSSETVAFQLLEATCELEEALRRRLLPTDKFVYPLFSLAYLQPGLGFFDLPIGFVFGNDNEKMWVVGFHPVELRFVLAEWKEMTFDLKTLENTGLWEATEENPVFETPQIYLYGRRKRWFSDAISIASHLFRALRSPTNTPFSSF